jgi:hypothetical protein
MVPTFRKLRNGLSAVLQCALVEIRVCPGAWSDVVSWNRHRCDYSLCAAPLGTTKQMFQFGCLSSGKVEFVRWKWQCRRGDMLNLQGCNFCGLQPLCNPENCE